MTHPFRHGMPPAVADWVVRALVVLVVLATMGATTYVTAIR